jgi:hypothetical protein
VNMRPRNVVFRFKVFHFGKRTFGYVDDFDASFTDSCTGR